jgi:enoyl-CoA hydratase
MNYTKYEALEVVRRGNVLHITLNRPDALNAIDRQSLTELSTVFIEASMDAEADIVVLTGAGRAFSAGGDWNWMLEQIREPDQFYEGLVNAKRMLYSVIDCEKPIVCRLNGDAVGMGCTLALACDFVIADDRARLADPHVRVGLVTGDGGATLWSCFVGHMRAKKYLLTGDFIEAGKAEEIGLITAAVPADELDVCVGSLVKKLASGPTRAVAWSKAVINIGLRQALSASLDAALSYEALSNQTADHKAAVEAFLKGEKPAFASAARFAG